MLYLKRRTNDWTDAIKAVARSSMRFVAVKTRGSAEYPGDPLSL
jgi:hypothetical protein